jgi:hypothetical protein
MNKISYLLNKKRFTPQEKVSEWGNKMTLEHKQILSEKQNMVCEYVLFHKIEKVEDWRYDHDVEWNYRNDDIMWRAAATTCIRCFGGLRDGELTVRHNDIRVTSGADMIPLYVKWAYRIAEGEFTTWNGKNYAVLQNPEMMEKLRKIYMSLTKLDHPDRLPEFVECKCERCGNEWIVF